MNEQEARDLAQSSKLRRLVEIARKGGYRTKQEKSIELEYVQALSRLYGLGEEEIRARVQAAVDKG